MPYRAVNILVAIHPHLVRRMGYSGNIRINCDSDEDSVEGNAKRVVSPKVTTKPESTLDRGSYHWRWRVSLGILVRLNMFS